MSNTIAIYPGSFDPFTNGHLDIVERALKVLDNLIIGVAVNCGKNTLFSLAERIDIAKAEIAKLSLPKGKTIEVKSIDNLAIDFAHDVGATIIVRGLRAVSDFELEFKLCAMNRRLDEKIETMFLMAGEKHQFISSAFTKEVARLGGDISSFVSSEVADRIKRKFKGE